MTFLITTLSDVFHFTVEGIRASFSVFTSGFQLSYFIGQNIVSLLVHVLEKVYLALQLVYYTAYILYEDYCFFIADFISKVKWVLSGIHSFVTYAYCCYQQVIMILKNTYDSLIYYIGSNFEFIGTAVEKGIAALFSALDILKQSLIFMGTGIWFGISFVPFSVIYIVTLFLCFISQSIVELYLVLCNILGTFLFVVEKTVLFFSDIPAEAAFGLLVGSIGSYFILKNYSYFIQCVSDIFSSLLRSGQLITRVWNTLKYCARRMFPPRTVNTRASNTAEMHQAFNVNRSFEDNECNSSRCTTSRPFGELGNKLCIVCQDLEKSVIILPCRHVCLCSVCCDIIEEQYGRCPICRQRVERTMTVYI